MNVVEYRVAKQVHSTIKIEREKLIDTLVSLVSLVYRCFINFKIFSQILSLQLLVTSSERSLIIAAILLLYVIRPRAQNPVSLPPRIKIQPCRREIARNVRLIQKADQKL